MSDDKNKPQNDNTRAESPRHRLAGFRVLRRRSEADGRYPDYREVLRLANQERLGSTLAKRVF